MYSVSLLPVEHCIIGQQSQFNCAAGLLESVTTPEQVIDKSCFWPQISESVDLSMELFLGINFSQDPGALSDTVLFTCA